MEPFREIEHSGDIGIEARGTDLRELFANAARGLFALMVRNRVGRTVARTVTVSSESGEDLLVDWLGAIISSADSNGEVYGDLEVTLLAGNRIEATLFGETVDARVHDLRFEVKAATYHELRLERTGTGYVARIIFDL